MKRRSLLAAAAVLLTSAFADPSAAPPQKWALIVGVGDYRNYGDEEGGDLAGAAGDARNMREVLVARWGFRAENVRLLTDADATRDAIRLGLTEWLPANAQPGDLIVFYFSGHGSQTFDQNGDEEDGLDETICPTDALRNNASADIKDDELGGWLRDLPTRNVTVILDSCHSGTATRSVAPFARRKALDRSGASDLPAPAAPARPAGARQASLDGAGPEVLEMSAAQADQYALETTFEENGASRTGGAFTTPLVRFLWQVSPRTSHQELFRLTREELRRANFAQTPQISAVPSRTRPAFALPDAETAAPAPAPPTLVVATDGPRRVVLGGGSVAGMAMGSYFRSGDALLQVVQVEPARATAELVGNGALPASGQEAGLVAVPLRPAVLRVSVAALPADGIRALAGMAGTLPNVSLQTAAGAPAQLVVRPEGGNWIVTGADGGERHRVPAADAEAAARALAALLRREQTAFELASLENPGYPFAVDFGFAGERNAFRLGETVSFRVRSARAGYLTIVDVDPAGKVTVIFPNRFDSANRIEADQEVVVPTAAMNFAFHVVEPVGRGVVRAFVTAQPLVLPFATGEAESAEVIAPALRAAAGPPPAPDALAVPVGSWATASVVYDFTR